MTSGLELTKTYRIPGRGFSLIFSIVLGFLGLEAVKGASANVQIVDFAFNPSSVTIHVNDNVVWTWVGPTVHTATSNSGLWDSGLLNAGNSRFSHTFASSGSFPYFCEVHPFMTASVTVQSQTPPNIPPTAVITSPANGATFAAPWTGTIQATVGDSDGTVTQVVFMVGSTAVATVPNPPANPSFTVNNLAAGSYTLTVIATDNAGASTTSAPVNITVSPQTQTNAPPVITITSPPDGSIFPAPWTGTIQVTNSDSEGTITQIDFLAGVTLLGTLVNPPANASLTVSNLAAGNYTLTAVATDSVGASTTSTPVHILVTTQTNQPPPGVTNLAAQPTTAVRFNPQTGLFDQSVSVNNLGNSPVAGVRMSVLGLPGDVVLYNASGSTNGTPFVNYNRTLNPGDSVAFLLEYYRSNRVEFVSTNFIATAISPTVPVAPAGNILQLDRTPFLFQGALVIEFASVPGKTYVVEYSADASTWSTAVPPIRASGTRVQWIDTGPPKTDSPPGAAGQRFYRVVQLR